MIYFDNAATTRMHKEVVDKMTEIMNTTFGNPSGIYNISRKSAIAISDAKYLIADSINAYESEIFFTSGATEANNWAIIGSFENNKDRGNHIITTKIEHESVLKTCEYLSKHRNAEVTYINVDEKGIVDLDELKSSIKDNTILVSVMYVNNEVGTIQPIKEISKILENKNIIFHCDAVQAYGKIKVDVKDLKVDMLTTSAHKLHGPKGIGFLYIREGVSIKSFIHGGHQQNGRRAGTENIPAIVGFAKAVEIEHTNMEKDLAKVKEIRDYCVERLNENITRININGDVENRISNNLNISIDMIDAESTVIALDLENIAISTGSACTSGSTDPSHVLLAMGVGYRKARESLRITFDKYNTKIEVDILVEKLKNIVENSRRILI